MPEVQFYAVRSKDGKYLRSKGMSSRGDSWVDNLNSAKIYPKIGPAKAQVTWWAKNFPEYGIPEIVVFDLVEQSVVDCSKAPIANLKKIIKDHQKTISGYQSELDHLQNMIDDRSHRTDERLRKIGELQRWISWRTSDLEKETSRLKKLEGVS